MNKNGPIIIIEDDLDDQYMLGEAFNSLNCSNEIIYFADGFKALDFLENSDLIPFLIISDINMPMLDGFELRRKLHTDARLRLKCIPYLFFSTAVSQAMVVDAYSISVQGFFVKQTSFDELVKTISVIVEYWKRCASPNNFFAGS